MFKKVVGAFLINILWICTLSADLNWWRPKEIGVLSGYTDSYAVAMNQNGTAIAMFDDKIFGSYDLKKNTWNFTYLNWSSSELPHMTYYCGTGNHEFSIGKPSKGTAVVLSNLSEGWAIISIPQGVHKDKIAVVHYSAGKWEDPVLLSEEGGKEPTLAQGADGRVLAVWINKQSGALMTAHYDGTAWIKQGSISSYKSVELDYNQVGPQLVMSDLGDAIVVWKVQNTKGHDDKALLVAQYFDGIEEQWSKEEVIGSQPIERKGRDLTINFQGEALLVWDTEEGIETANMNLMKYMIYQSGWTDVGDQNTKDQESAWTVTTVAEGEELNMPKACLDRQGNAVVIWLEGYEGIRSAYFDHKLKSWNLIQEPVTHEAAYATGIKLDGANHGQALWIGEGPALSEILYSRMFDFSAKAWSETYAINSHCENSLIDAIDAYSVAKSNYGMVMWYDFFQEQLYYSVLRGDIEEPYNRRKEGRLYKKKAELAKRRAERGLPR